MPTTDYASYVKVIDDLVDKPKITKVLVSKEAFEISKKDLPDDRCVLCSASIIPGAKVVFVGLVGRYYDYHAFCYLVHEGCALVNLDLIRTVEDPKEL